MNCFKLRADETRARQSKYDIRRLRKAKKSILVHDCYPLFTLAHVVEPVLAPSRFFEKCSRKRARILRAGDRGSVR